MLLGLVLDSAGECTGAGVGTVLVLGLLPMLEGVPLSVLTLVLVIVGMN